MTPKRSSRMSVSVVIPCFRPGRALVPYIQTLDLELAKLVPGLTWEILLVADGKEAANSRYLFEAAAASSKTRVLRHLGNYGEQAALQTGIAESSGQVILTLDDDGQHPVKEMRALILPVLKGHASLVYAEAIFTGQTKFRDFLSWLGKRFISWLAGVPVRSITSFRAFSGAVRPAFDVKHSRRRVIDAVLLDHFSEVVSVPVRFQVRKDGKSGYDTRRLFGHWLNLLYSFPSRPMKIVTWLGALTSLVGLVQLFLTALDALTTGGNSPPGYATLVGILILFSGVQLLSAGILGGYVARIYEDSITTQVIHPISFQEVEGDESDSVGPEFLNPSES